MNPVIMPERFSDLPMKSNIRDVVRLPNPKNTVESQERKIDGFVPRKKSRRRKDDGLALVNVRSIKEYFHKEKNTGCMPNGKRKLIDENIEENKKFKVGLSD